MFEFLADRPAGTPADWLPLARPFQPAACPSRDIGVTLNFVCAAAPIRA